MNRSYDAYGSTKPPVAVAHAIAYDRLMTAFVVAAMGALIYTWVHFSPFASIAMAR